MIVFFLHYLFFFQDKTVKLWKVSERDRRVADSGWNLKPDQCSGSVGCLKLPSLVPMEMVVEASPRRVYANAHTYHINSISVNSDLETFLSADDLRINLWHLEIVNQSFSKVHTTPHCTTFFMYLNSTVLTVDIVDIKPSNMEELTEVITSAEFHPHSCNYFAYSSSKGTIRLCDMRERALCDQHAKGETSRDFFPPVLNRCFLNLVFEEPEDPTNRTFFSEIISSISDVKFSHNGQYMLTRDYLTVKVLFCNFL